MSLQSELSARARQILRAPAKHTPGPWHIGHHGSVVSEPDKALGPVTADHVEYYGGGCVAESIAKSDQPAIAAVPDLLAALEGILPWAAYVINENHPQMKAALKAIAEAKGLESQ